MTPQPVTHRQKWHGASASFLRRVHTRVTPLKPPPGMRDVGNGWKRSHMRMSIDLAETHSVSAHAPDLKDGGAGEKRPRPFNFKQNNAGLHDLVSMFLFFVKQGQVLGI